MLEFIGGMLVMVIAICAVVAFYGLVQIFTVDGSPDSAWGVWLFLLASSCGLGTIALKMALEDWYYWAPLPAVLSLAAVWSWWRLHKKLIELGEMIPLRYWIRR